MSTPTQPTPITASTAGHTPGPWRKSSHDSLKGVFHIDAGPMGYERKTVAIINAEKQSEANARLIAAAPDLLAALEAFEQGPPDGDNTDGWFAQYALNLEAARAAIARATANP